MNTSPKRVSLTGFEPGIIDLVLPATVDAGCQTFDVTSKGGNKSKGLNVIDGVNIPTPFKNEDNKLDNSMTEKFFQTQLQK